MNKLYIYSVAFLLISCTESEKTDLPGEVNSFLQSYTDEYLELYYESALAEWEANTHIVEGDTMNAWRVSQANEALAAFTGSQEVISKALAFLEQKDQLEPLQVKQLETILYEAANNPATVEELVKERIKAEARQTEKLYGFDFKIEGESVSTNAIDDVLKSEMDLDTRLKTWETSKEVGKVLKEGLRNLQKLRNQTVQALDYADYFSYQVSDYGMTTREMMDLNSQLVRDVWPLYRQLHTYVRYELADRYAAEVPDHIPAHWLPNRWGQDWSPVVEVEGIDLDGILEEKGPEWLIRQAERFYISLGFDSLPDSFYEKSSLYPLPDSVDHKKNNHASAWHLDLQDDVRCLMSVIPTASWYETTHHELGHIYYYISYTNPEVPPLLRGGANRAFHEGVGSLMGLAAMQKPFLAHLELIDEDTETNEIQTLLKEALNYVVFIPWSAGVMTSFEHDLYVEELPPGQYNQRWWEFKKKYQGIIPPSERGEEYCDAASKTHINNDAAQYYDYALSFVILFQLHDHIANNILGQDPEATNYYGSKETGTFLRTILEPGATRDWRQLMKETTGEEINAKAMLEYFSPLMEYLKVQNQGRTHSLPESFE